MNNFRMPEGIWTWRATVLVASLVLAPLMAVLLLRAESRDVASASTVADVVTYLAVLAAAILVYFHWRATASRAAAWLTTVLLVVGVNGVVRAAVLLSHPDAAADLGRAVLLQLVLALVVVAFAALAEQHELRYDPVVLGLALGAGLTAVQLVINATFTWQLPDEALFLGRQALLMAVPATAVLVLQLTTLEAWVRGRLALAVVLLNLGQIGTYLDSESGAVHVVAIAADLAGASLLLATTIALLRVSIGAARDEITDLQDQLELAEAGVRVDRERLHEIGSTIAGIASATQVMRAGTGITEQRRHLLQQMLDSEIARLERLIAARAPLGPRVFSVDEVISPLVLSHQSRGHVVEWTPTDLSVVGNPDDLAEVVNILLENASRHGGGDATQLGGRLVDDRVEITVTDRGPGVPASQRERIFEWGVRSEASPGQGIGLHIAASLMTKNGGSLVLAPSIHRGASFVATMNEAVVAHDVYSH